MSPWVVGVIAMLAITAVILFAVDARRSALSARQSAQTASAHLTMLREQLAGQQDVRRCAQCSWELRWCDASGCRGLRSVGWRSRAGMLT